MSRERFSANPRLLLALLRNPSAALALRGAEDLPIGLIGAAASVVGFYVWVLAVQNRVEHGLSFFSTLFMGGLFSAALAFKLLLLGLLSLLCVTASLSAVGNRLGRRKRSWIEIVTHQGGSQLMFGAGYLVSSVVAFLSVKLSLALTGGLLLLSLLLLVIHALELHEVERRDSFVAVTLSVAAYVVLFSLFWALLF
ncbi:hypothetical protein [Cohnella sp. JJ-181]|uniref:hypothetical protein n=1 Tax=Cohnella rhizoplanae TaxID=2974897 RepID=UPI0022FFBFF7|nr:hypothetical protein [Cohnella sp. JJ-181]CAI6044637.1 hypothetical protein COHCIP112018_01227 [Cohnella sp. JJ-181]